MASRKRGGKKAAKKETVLTIDPSIKCTICLELFNDPRVLPCLHTFCLNCLQGLAKDGVELLPCPLCRDKHTIPTNGGVSTYPLNTYILSEIEETRVKLGSSQDEEGIVKICGFCKTINGEVVAFCDNCEEYLCAVCRDGIHTTGKVLVNHKVRKVGKKQVETEAALSYKPPSASSFCIHHPNYKLEVYCRDCVSLVCCKCTVGPHKGHDYEELTENVILEVEEKIGLLTVENFAKEEMLKASFSFVEKAEGIVLAQQDELRAKIKAFFDLLTEMTESRFTEDNKKLWATKNNIETLLSHINSSHSFTTHVLELVLKKEELSLVNQVLQTLVKINNTVKPTEEVWSLSSTSTTYQEKLDQVIDLTKLSNLCSEEEKKMYGQLQNNIQPCFDITAAKYTPCQYQHDVKTGYRGFNIGRGLYEGNVKVCVTLEHPFAQCTDWYCETVSHGGTGSLVATALPGVAISNQEVQLYVPKERSLYVFNDFNFGCNRETKHYKLVLSPEFDINAPMTFSFDFV